jgi:predicted RND superfamily exporter protein
VLAAVLATGWGLALIWLSGQQLTPFTVALGSLTAAVGCEFTVLLAGAGTAGRRGVRRAVGLAVASAAVGFLVITGSELTALREFGVLLAWSVVLSYLASRAVVWALPPGRAEVDGRPGDQRPAPRPDHHGHDHVG